MVYNNGSLFLQDASKDFWGADRHFYLLQSATLNRPHAVKQPHHWMGASRKQKEESELTFWSEPSQSWAFSCTCDIPCVLLRKYSTMSLQQWLPVFGKLIAGTDCALRSLMWPVWFCIFISIHKIMLLYDHCKGPNDENCNGLLMPSQVLPTWTELPLPAQEMELPFSSSQWHLLCCTIWRLPRQRESAFFGRDHNFALFLVALCHPGMTESAANILTFYQPVLNVSLWANKQWLRSAVEEWDLSGWVKNIN